MIDWSHVIETVAAGLFTGGMAWGAIRAEIRALKEADKRTDRRLDHESQRIDSLYTRIFK